MPEASNPAVRKICKPTRSASRSASRLNPNCLCTAKPVPPIMEAAAKSGLLRAANKPIKIPAKGKSESCF